MNGKSKTIVIVVAIGLGAAITFATLPSEVTFDISAKSDFVAFTTPFSLDKKVLLVTTGSVCDQFSPNAVSEQNKFNPCESYNRPVVVKDEDFKVKYYGRTSFLISKTGERNLSILMRGIDANSDIVIDHASSELHRKELLILLGSSDSKSSETFSFSSDIEELRVGGLSQLGGGSRGSFLLSGKINVLSKSMLSHGVLVSPELELGLGDTVDSSGNSSRKIEGNLFLRTESGDPIEVSARIVASQLMAWRGNGSGIPVSFTWWQRLTAEPLLLVLWAIVGGLMVLVNFWDKLVIRVWEQK